MPKSLSWLTVVGALSVSVALCLLGSVASPDEAGDAACHAQGPGPTSVPVPAEGAPDGAPGSTGLPLEVRLRILDERAHAQVAAGKMNDALVTAHKALELAPESREALLLSAWVHEQAGDNDAAGGFYAALVARQPQDGGAHLHLGRARLAQGRLIEAIDSCREALRLGIGTSASRDAHVALGMAQSQLGRLEDAAAELQAAVNLDSQSAEAHYELGNVLMDQGKLPEAASEFAAAVRLAPDRAGYQNHLGITLLWQGEYSLAAQAFEAALRLSPKEPNYLCNYGSALLGDGQVEPAVVVLRRALALNGDHDTALYHLGRALVMQHALEEATQKLRQAVELEPAAPAYRQALAYALSAQGQPAEAAEQLHLAVRLAPRVPEYREDLGQTLIAAGRTEAGLAELQAAAELAPDRAQAHSLLGSALTETSRLDEGIAHLTRAVELDPTLLEARQALAFAYAYQGRWEEAVACCRIMREAAPESPLTAITHGTVVALAGDFASSREVLQTCVDTPDHLTFVHVALAYCLACQGETEAARQELSRVSELCRGEAPAVELLYLTGRTYDRLGRPAPTREVFRRALGLYPSHPWAVEMRAWLERGGDDLADSAGG